MRNAKTRVCLDPLADQYGHLGANAHDMAGGGMYLHAFLRGGEGVGVGSFATDNVGDG